MAQYGIRSYYGASYYGMSGVFAGQFISDETYLITPLTNTPPSDGRLYVDIICSHPRVSYNPFNEIFIIEGQYERSGNTILLSDPLFRITANLIASSIYIDYVRKINGAIVDVKVDTYINGELVQSNTYEIDTIGPGPYAIESLPYGEQIVTITMNDSSDPGSVFEFNGITAMTTDIRLEMRGRKGGVWSRWGQITLTASEENVTYRGFNNVYKYHGTTDDWSGVDAYQFRLALASSDNTNSPEVISIDIHTANTSDYSSNGYWKTTIDLGGNVTSIDDVTFEVSQPEGTSVEIRTRTSDIDGNWSSWSLPYSSAERRAIIDYKNSPSTKNGYIITPVISPEYLTNWNRFILTHYINTIDTLTGAGTPGADIVVEIVKPTYNPLSPSSSDVIAAFTYKTAEQVYRSISNIREPIRMKINFNRTTAVASPATEMVSITADAYYSEYRAFGTGQNEYRGYASSVYGDNTGVDKVYTDDLTRSKLASISSFNFTIPQGAENPEYLIESDMEDVSIYWASNGKDSVYLENGLTDDYLMVRVKDNNNERTRRHYRYGSGVVTVLEPGYMTINLTNTFTPTLIDGRQYAFYIMNGFVLSEPNPNVDIRWRSENHLEPVQRRNITYTLNDQVCISIISGNVYGLVDWTSEEKKFDAVVNLNDEYRPYVVTLLYSDDPVSSQLPEIEPGIILNPDPSIIPYKVEVIEGSVTSHGERQDESRIKGSIRYLYANEITPSLVESVETMVPVVRGSGSTDRLPKAMIKRLNGVVNGVVLGVYSDPSLPAPDYLNKIDPTTGNELASGHYRYYAEPGTYSNIIDWSPGIAIGDVPEEGDVYYVSYVYDKVVSLRVEFTCDYSEYRSNAQIYRSPVLQFTGKCSPMVDYVSQPLTFDDFIIPDDVDKSTLKFVVYDDNPRVRTYIDNNRVVGTMDRRDPRESWNPHIKGGYYYIGKDKYYMFTNEAKYILGESVIPRAENIIYTDDSNIIIQEETENLFVNNILEKGQDISDVFIETFARSEEE